MTARKTAAWRGRLGARMQQLLPTLALSTLVHWLTRVRAAWFKNPLITVFVLIYRVDLSDAEIRDPHAYACFNAFFTRRLAPGARPQPADRRLLVSPADGRLSAFGGIRAQRLIQAKGRDYSLIELLAGDEHSTALADGDFATIYLAPNDYHRLHMPWDARLLSWRYVPGRLFAVNPATTAALPRLFVRNERLIACFEAAGRPLLLVMVGALLVGGLQTAWAGAVTPPHRRSRGASHHYHLGQPIDYRRGDEIGCFNMGSTVILLAAPGLLRWRPGLVEDMVLRVGQPLAACEDLP
ncbi:MAG: phosphatidylserine decarboxylase [Gammaproteobacteria bacterium]|nr:phosphatidylserine decarboxylase [Gammaproteobacteria bacterium]